MKKEVSLPQPVYIYRVEFERNLLLIRMFINKNEYPIPSVDLARTSCACSICRGLRQVNTEPEIRNVQLHRIHTSYGPKAYARGNNMSILFILKKKVKLSP
jgi:hypothetical protein